MEINDSSILKGLRREKNEEISKNVSLYINPTVSYNVHFIKNSGQHMILPHYYASYDDGEIVLSDEYDDYKWVPVAELGSFSPKVENISAIVDKLLILKQVFTPNDFIKI